MGSNCGYLVSRIGILKILIIIFGATSIGLGSYAHFQSYYIWKVKEEALIGICAACLSISIFYTLAHLSSETLAASKVNRAIDAVYHVLASVTLMIIGVIVADSTVEIDRKVCGRLQTWSFSVSCQLYEEKLASAVLTLINGVLYGITACFIFNRGEVDKL